MMHEFLNFSWLSQAVGTLIRLNGPRNDTKTYSTATDAVNHSNLKPFRLSRPLIGDSSFVIALIISFVCGMIQPATSATMTSTYSSSFSSNSPTFSRPDSNSSKYYYQAIQVTVYMTGMYTFTSNSSMSLDGYFYNGPFNVSYPSKNLITSNNNRNGFGQFEISHSLESAPTYILVVTTSDNSFERSFSIMASGPNSVRMISITSSSNIATFIATTRTPWSTQTSFRTPWPIQASPSTLWPTRSSSSSPWPTQTSPSTLWPTLSSSSSPWSTQTSLSTPWPTLSSSSSPWSTQTSLSTPWPTRSSSSSPWPTQTSPSTPWPTQSSSSSPWSTQTSSSPTSLSTWPVTTMTTSAGVTSIYSNSLSSNSPTFVRPRGNPGNYYYYQAIQVITYTTTTYTFRSNSFIDTYGCFYDLVFDPSDPSQYLIVCDDDSAGDRQFLISSYLQSGRTYILVVTTYDSAATGSYSVIAMGPTHVYMSSITPSTYPTSSTNPTTSTVIPTIYSGILSQNSPTFFRPGGNKNYYYYYQAIQVITYTIGTYIFTSSSSMDTYGCFYDLSFYPSRSFQNLIKCDDNSGGDRQFSISSQLQYGRTYILVVTTYNGAINGSYSVTATGPDAVHMTSITPGTPTYSGTLSSDSPVFIRPNGYAGDSYYYQAIRTTIDTYGTYTLRSSSSMDTYGCLYVKSFDSSNPSQNLITCDQDSGGSHQFFISYYLQSGNTYILVVTTFDSDAFGSYSITATGPGSVTMTSYTSSNSLTTLQIVAITIGCVLLCTVILFICARKRKRQTPVNQRLISSTSNRNSCRRNAFMPSAQRNATQVNVNNMPYTTPVSTSSFTVPEEPPPSYESYMSSLRPQE